MTFLPESFLKYEAIPFEIKDDYLIALPDFKISWDDFEKLLITLFYNSSNADLSNHITNNISLSFREKELKNVLMTYKGGKTFQNAKSRLKLIYNQ